MTFVWLYLTMTNEVFPCFPIAICDIKTKVHGISFAEFGCYYDLHYYYTMSRVLAFIQADN